MKTRTASKPRTTPDLQSATPLPAKDTRGIHETADLVHQAEALAEKARELVPLLKRRSMESTLPDAESLADADILGGLASLAWLAETVASQLRNAGSLHVSALLGEFADEPAHRQLNANLLAQVNGKGDRDAA